MAVEGSKIYTKMDILWPLLLTLDSELTSMSPKSSASSNPELTGLKENDCGGDGCAVVKLGFEESLFWLMDSKELRLDGGSKVEASRALREERDNEEKDEADRLAEKETLSKNRFLENDVYKKKIFIVIKFKNLCFSRKL